MSFTAPLSALIASATALKIFAKLGVTNINPPAEIDKKMKEMKGKDEKEKGGRGIYFPRH
jgi:hypothetical protein